MNLFKSKEQKALEAKIAVHRGVNDLKKCERSLNKKREEMIRFAQDAKKEGMQQQYAVAVNGLKMVLGYQKRCKAMILQLQMTESMRDLTSISSKFVKLMGSVGKEVSAITKATNFAGNQLSFEKGMLAAESAMDQLEGFLEDAGMSFETESDEALNAEIEALIDSTGAGREDPIDVEIEERLAEVTGMRAKVEEQDP